MGKIIGLNYKGTVFAFLNTYIAKGTNNLNMTVKLNDLPALKRIDKSICFFRIQTDAVTNTHWLNRHLLIS